MKKIYELAWIIIQALALAVSTAAIITTVIFIGAMVIAP